MVEKIIINGKVRALGNIVEEKTVDDYLTYYSRLSKTTDTVDGTSMNVYNSMSTVVFVDHGVINNSNLSNWTSNSTIATVTEQYTELTQPSSTTSATYLAINIPPKCKICFDIYQIGGTGSNFFFRIDNGGWQGYFGGDGLSWINGGLNEWVPVEITFKDKEIYTKNLDTGTVHQDIATAPSTLNAPVFRFWIGPEKTLRFKNFYVFEL